jgi:hypothetical protein
MQLHRRDMRVEYEERTSQRADLELFIREYFGNISVDFSHGDSPDLTIKLGSKVVGVEHTRIYRARDSMTGLEPHAQLREQHRIVSYAWEAFRAFSTRKLWLVVHFDNETSYTKRESRSLGDSLAKIVHEETLHIPYQPDRIIWHDRERWRYETCGRLFPKGVNRLDFQIVDGNPKLELWGPAHAYMVPHLSALTVKERVENKETRLPKYLTKCDEAWLLMVLDTGVPSNHFDIDEELLETEYSTLFSKLLLFRATHSEIFELKTGPRVD